VGACEQGKRVGAGLWEVVPGVRTGRAEMPFRCEDIQERRMRLHWQMTGAQACWKGEGSDGERATGEGRAEVRGWVRVGRKEAHLGI
jgi:hypothetical protein